MQATHRYAHTTRAFTSAHSIVLDVRAAFTRGLFGGGRGSVHQQTLKGIAENIRERKFRRIVVMAGAGISTPSGIPDFSWSSSAFFRPIRNVESASGHLIILIGCSDTATCWFGKAFHLTQAQNGRATWLSSVGLVCQANFGHRRCRREATPQSAFIATSSSLASARSPGSGLYDNLQQYNLPYAEAIFEINYFHHNPNPFFALAKELYPGNFRPNLTHYFIRLLHDKGQLLRMYTQNIDGLERMAGIPPEMLVEAHGTFATATCTVCRRDYKGEELRNDIMEGKIPKCPTCKGIVKPDIVFFGEELPQQFFSYLTDFPVADLLIVMGTSLEVEPFASLAGAVRGSVTRLLINRDLVGPFAWGSQRHNDVAELGDVVSGVKKLVELLGWKQELEALMNAGGDEFFEEALPPLPPRRKHP
ncbi:NAD-dependent protein deacetylase sirtuin-3, mitochondrial [Anabarilius grahami]|uniref:NAD-dependent protein deacetylase n=1 Tax=Anabarilius grahami TaxID=495550 RepID=A0A3N0Y4Z4_ANAGA|nr:NAD-dependent protein deacetylase sirtuin-3, mitochondrial [Anabarilius grahami]